MPHDTDKANHYLDKLIASEPEDSEVFGKIIGELLGTDQVNFAQTIVDRGLKAYPDSVPFMIHHLAISIFTENFNLARKIAKKARQLATKTGASELLETISSMEMVLSIRETFGGFLVDTKNSMMNPFDVLSVDESASDADVKKAYFQMVRQFTPEKHAERFKQIREAYDLLKDPSRRLEAEVFSFMKPSSAPDSEDIELPPIQLNSDVFLAWVKQTLTDLERKDFTSDFNEVL